MKENRYYYYTVGYGITSLLGVKYRMGRIEIHDKEGGHYAIDEGFYCMPHEEAYKFEEFIDNLESDLPIHFTIGSVEECVRATEEILGIEKGKLGDKETIRKFYESK